MRWLGFAGVVRVVGDGAFAYGGDAVAGDG